MSVHAGIISLASDLSTIFKAQRLHKRDLKKKEVSKLTLVGTLM